MEVIPWCNVSTERGAAGAELDSGCPAHTRQTLVRELLLDPEHRDPSGSATREQLVLVLNF